MRSVKANRAVFDGLEPLTVTLEPLALMKEFGELFCCKVTCVPDVRLPARAVSGPRAAVPPSSATKIGKWTRLPVARA